jgi:predicted site-specific integrase-resolvase
MSTTTKESRNIRVIQPKQTLLPGAVSDQPAKKKRVCAYARVSTEDKEQLSSYTAQVDYYTRYIQSNPEWEFVDVYTDEETSYGQIPKSP